MKLRSLSLALLVPAALHAADLSAVGQMKTVAARPFHFVEQPPKRVLAPAPNLQAAEISSLREMQKQRTAKDAVLTARETTGAGVDMLAVARADQMTYTRILVLQACGDAEVLACREILAYRMPSPTDYASDLTPITPRGVSYGYPAGHAVVLYTGLAVLEECAGRALPEVRSFVELTQKRRLRGALDWPSVVQAAPALAAEYVKIMRPSAQYQALLQMAHSEWRK